MIGDVIGRPRPGAVERELPGCATCTGWTSSRPTARTSRAGWASPRRRRSPLYRSGVDVITSATTSGQEGILPALDKDERILRPHNYGTDGIPGRGWGAYVAADGTDIAVLNFQGRTYMIRSRTRSTDADACSTRGPTRCRRSGSLTSLRGHHEKNAFGLHLDGRVSAVVGRTRTSDGGRADPSPWDGLPERPRDDRPASQRDRLRARDVLPRFINGLPTRFEVGTWPVSSTPFSSTWTRPPAGPSRGARPTIVEAA